MIGSTQECNEGKQNWGELDGDNRDCFCHSVVLLIQRSVMEVHHLSGGVLRREGE